MEEKRKVFISFLGFSDYKECKYTKNNFISNSVRYIQEATLDFLNQKNPWTSNDVVMILLTKGAKEKNWVDNGQVDKCGQRIIQTGLFTQLKGMNLPFKIEPLFDLPNGNDEKEIIDIFSKVFERLNQGDEIYFDVTHGFRSLPMLALVLGNYAKFLKDISVKSITYGQVDLENNKYTIVDLLSLSNILDWTFAAADFLENGNVNKLASLSEVEYKSVLKESRGEDENAQLVRKMTLYLKEVVYDFQTCRGMNIVRSTNISLLKNVMDKIHSTFIEPMNPLLDKINGSMSVFSSEEDIKNGFMAARWCLNKGLFQQAATILLENVVTFFALRHNIKIDDEDSRELINKAFIITFNNSLPEKWDVSQDVRPVVEEILTDEFFKDYEIVNEFNCLRDLRNDLNHSGMRSKNLPLKACNIHKNIEKAVKLFEKKLV